jgi:hypothetical protein
MNLRLERVELHPAYTMGRLYVDGNAECWVLEDTVRDGPKVPGATAIPFGSYPVILDHSRRFNRIMPLICDVPGFRGVRIHAGNTVADTEGCLIVGTTRIGATVIHSRPAYNALFAKLEAAKARGESITLDIVRKEPAV